MILTPLDLLAIGVVLLVVQALGAAVAVRVILPRLLGPAIPAAEVTTADGDSIADLIDDEAADLEVGTGDRQDMAVDHDPEGPPYR